MLNIKKDDNCFSLNETEAINYGKSLNSGYLNSKPFNHVVINDFLPRWLADDVLDKFPISRSTSDVEFKSTNFENLKRQVSPYNTCAMNLNLFYFFNSSPFLTFLESLTGIRGLIGDPYYGGGGFHEISRGGKLGIHADFRIHPKLKLHRKINVLIYLNKDWENDWCGNLELWDRDMSNIVESIEPSFNKCVIFNTESDAYHGHPEPMLTPEGYTRKSIALYYYSASYDAYGEAPNISTIFKSRPLDNNKLKYLSNLQNLREKYFSLSQWMPPILYYFARSIYSKFLK